jgi:polar amino acid transport system substrate-binding protein
MNANNATLVTRGVDGTVSGLSADLGRFIAGKLGVTYDPVVYDSAAPFTASFSKNEWDIIVTGKNAVVEKLVDFSADLFSIEYVYVAAPGREFADPSQVDAPGIRIAVPRNASADVFLSRTLKSAALVRVDGDLNVGIELLRAGKAEVYASSINSAQVMVSRWPEARIVSGAFYIVPFAVAMQKGRSAAAQSRLTQMVNEAKSAGIVQKALEQAGAKGVRVAP